MNTELAIQVLEGREEGNGADSGRAECSDRAKCSELTPAQLQLRAMVLGSVTSPHSRRNYAKALDLLFAFADGRPLTLQCSWSTGAPWRVWLLQQQTFVWPSSASWSPGARTPAC